MSKLDSSSGSDQVSDSSSEFRGYILYGIRIILGVILGLFLIWMVSIFVFVFFRTLVDPHFSLAESYAVSGLWTMAWVLYRYGKNNPSI